jgi:selenocysteine-specific elongation factor
VVQAALETGCVDLGDAERRLVAESALEHWRDTLRATLEGYHREHPLQPGMSKAATGLEPILVDALLARWPEFAAEGELLRLASFHPTLKGEEDAALGKMEALFRDAGLAVPAVAEVLKASGVDANRSRTLLQTLLRDRKLVRVGTDLIFHASALEQLRALLAARKAQRFSVGEFKDWTGVSRKYAIPLLEYLDRERVTRREGDQRVVL